MALSSWALGNEAEVKESQNREYRASCKFILLGYMRVTYPLPRKSPYEAPTRL